MAVKYGLTIENQNLIIDKAKDKRDGVYTFRGVSYRVRGGKVTHFCDGKHILQPFGNFNVILRECKLHEQDTILKTING